MVYEVPYWRDYGTQWTDGLHTECSQIAAVPNLLFCTNCGTNVFEDERTTVVGADEQASPSSETTLDDQWEIVTASAGRIDLPTRKALLVRTVWSLNYEIRSLIEMERVVLCESHFQYTKQITVFLALALEVFASDETEFGCLFKAEVFRYLGDFESADKALSRDGERGPMFDAILAAISDESRLLRKVAV